MTNKKLKNFLITTSSLTLLVGGISFEASGFNLELLKKVNNQQTDINSDSDDWGDDHAVILNQPISTLSSNNCDRIAPEDLVVTKEKLSNFFASPRGALSEKLKKTSEDYDVVISSAQKKQADNSQVTTTKSPNVNNSSSNNIRELMSNSMKKRREMISDDDEIESVKKKEQTSISPLKIETISKLQEALGGIKSSLKIPTYSPLNSDALKSEENNIARSPLSQVQASSLTAVTSTSRETVQTNNSTFNTTALSFSNEIFKSPLKGVSLFNSGALNDSRDSNISDSELLLQDDLDRKMTPKEWDEYNNSLSEKNNDRGYGRTASVAVVVPLLHKVSNHEENWWSVFPDDQEDDLFQAEDNEMYASVNLNSKVRTEVRKKVAPATRIIPKLSSNKDDDSDEEQWWDVFQMNKDSKSSVNDAVDLTDSGITRAKVDINPNNVEYANIDHTDSEGYSSDISDINSDYENDVRDKKFSAIVTDSEASVEDVDASTYVSSPTPAVTATSAATINNSSINVSSIKKSHVIMNELIEMGNIVSKMLHNRSASPVSVMQIASGDDYFVPRIWAKGFGSSSSQKGDYAAKSKTFGGVIGGDIDLIEDKMMFGAAFTHAKLNVKEKDEDMVTANVNMGSLYLRHDILQTFVSANVSYGVMDIKNLTFTGSKNKANNFKANANLGHNIALENGAIITPKAGLYFDTIEIKGVKNSTIDQARKLNIKRITSDVSLSVAKDFKINDQLNLKPTLHFGINQIVKQKNAGYDITCLTQGQKTPKTSYNTGVSILAYGSNALSLDVGYNLSFKSKYKAYSGFVKLEVKF